MNSVVENNMKMECTRRARRSVVVYLILLASLPFLVIPMIIDPATQCVEYPCPSWLLSGAVTLGALFAIGAVSSLLSDHSWGSYVDSSTQTLYCWNGRKPKTREPIRVQTVPLADIVSVDVERGDESPDTILLKNAGGAVTRVSAEYITGPTDVWVGELIKLQLQIKRAEAIKKNS